MASRGRDLLRIVSVNDVYELGRLPLLKTALDKLKAGGHTTLCTINGDFTAPSVLSGMDKGRGMIDVLNRIPMTHCCFGNHEADIGIAALKDRIHEFNGVWLNSNIRSLQHPKLKPYDIVTTAGGWRVGLLGFLLDEPTAFRDKTFKGHEIEPVVQTAEELVRHLRDVERVDMIIPLTHQSIVGDEALAEADLGFPIILGGHEHEVYTLKAAKGTVIVKAGADCENAAVSDIIIEPGPKSVSFAVNVDIRSLDSEEPDVQVQSLVDQHMEVVHLLKEEVVCAVSSSEQTQFLPLESMRTRIRQTTVGRLIASTCRDELRTDCCFINGASIKGGKQYDPPELTFMQLKDELPFPTKMVACYMSGEVLREAVVYSRRAGGKDGEVIERRGYAQCCDAIRVEEETDIITHIQDKPLDPSKIYLVALPRNLLSGFCDIKPLMEWSEMHESTLPDEDAFTPCLNMILNRNAGNVWLRFGDFEVVDQNNDGVISRDELREAMQNKYGRKPSEPLLDTLISTLDVNKDGEISPWEYRKFVEKRKAAVCYAGSGGAVGVPADAAQRLDPHKF